MKSIILSYKFYIVFALIFVAPASWFADEISALVEKLPSDSFLYDLSSMGILEIPSALVILFLFFWIFNNFLWRFSWVRRVIGVPDINGRYEGSLTSTYTENKEQNGTYPIIIEISQTLTSIRVCLYTERSCSYSLISNICKNYTGNYELVYVYQNKTSAMAADADMRDHYGSAFLQISNDGNSLVGNYFNNPRERGRYGNITVVRTDPKLKGKF